MFESLDNIIGRVQKRHDLEGPPTDEEIAEHLPPIIPPTLENHVRSYSVSGNVLTIFLGDQTSRQELSLLAPRMCKQLNARLGRNALSKISTRTKK